MIRFLIWAGIVTGVLALVAVLVAAAVWLWALAEFFGVLVYVIGVGASMT